MVFLCKQKTSYEMRISDWSSDGCSSDLAHRTLRTPPLPWIGLPASGLRAMKSLNTSSSASLQSSRARAVNGSTSTRTIGASGIVRRIGHCPSTNKTSRPHRRPLQPRRLRQPAHQVRVLHRLRSEEHTSELQSLMRISYAVFCLKKKTKHTRQQI